MTKRASISSGCAQYVTLHTVKLDEEKVKKNCPYGSGKWFWLIIIVQRTPVKKECNKLDLTIAPNVG